ncbi:MAG: WD40 repeat domain-containing protein [Verrucomicrobia bacterium]|nr:WD40 repeat domain-containing protein [Verrucomicrobiota bacterium]
MDSRRLEQCGRWLADPRPWLGRVLASIAISKLRNNRSPDTARLLADVYSKHADPGVRKQAYAALCRFQEPRAIDAVCEVWLGNRRDRLAELLKRRGWVATAPPDLRTLTALKSKRFNPGLLNENGVIAALTRAAFDGDSEVSTGAVAALAGLVDPAQIEEFCDRLIRIDPGPLHKLARERGFKPRAPGRRALYLFLTGDRTGYEALDHDRSLLRACYEAADTGLRNRISTQIRNTGRADLMPVLHGNRQKRDLAGLLPREWETVVSVLRGNKRYQELWGLAFEVPPEWAAEILLTLQQAKFRPVSPSDAAVFDRLLKLCPVEGLRSRLYLPSPVCRNVLNTGDHAVRSLALSPDGRTLVSVSSDTTALLWELSGEVACSQISSRIGLALAAAFSPDGRFLAVAGTDNVARIWDLNTWRMSGLFRGHTDRISSLCFANDGTTLGTSSYDGTARLWNLENGECRRVLEGHEQSVLSLAFAPDGGRVATGSHDETVRVWSMSGGGCRSFSNGSFGSVCSLAFSDNGRTLASGSSEGTVQMWDLGGGGSRAVMAAHRGSVMALAFSPNGLRLASCSLDNTVAIWDTHSCRFRSRLNGHTDEVHALAFSPDGKSVVTGGRDHSIRIWEIAESKALINMNHDDLERIELRAAAASDAMEARPWHFAAALLRHRFRYDIELSELAERVFGEFEIEIEPV